LGRPTSALRSFQRTAELDPSRLSAVAEAGRLLLEMGETEEALSILQNSRGENAKQSTMLQIVLASALKTQAECCFSDARLRGASELLSTASAALQNLGPAGLGVASEVVHKLVGDVAALLSQVSPGEAVRGARSVESSQSVLSARRHTPRFSTLRLSEPAAGRMLLSRTIWITSRSHRNRPRRPARRKIF